VEYPETPNHISRRLLSYRDLKARGIKFSRVHLRRLEDAGKFPRHIDIGENTVGWFEDEIDDLLEAKAAARRVSAS
jgi:prophage regulatory protein